MCEAGQVQLDLIDVPGLATLFRQIQKPSHQLLALLRESLNVCGGVIAPQCSEQLASQLLAHGRILRPHGIKLGIRHCGARSAFVGPVDGLAQAQGTGTGLGLLGI